MWFIWSSRCRRLFRKESQSHYWGAVLKKCPVKKSGRKPARCLKHFAKTLSCCSCWIAIKHRYTQAQFSNKLGLFFDLKALFWDLWAVFGPLGCSLGAHSICTPRVRRASPPVWVQGMAPGRLQRGSQGPGISTQGPGTEGSACAKTCAKTCAKMSAKMVAKMCAKMVANMLEHDFGQEFKQYLGRMAYNAKSLKKHRCFNDNRILGRISGKISGSISGSISGR